MWRSNDWRWNAYFYKSRVFLDGMAPNKQDIYSDAQSRKARKNVIKNWIKFQNTLNN